MTTTTTRRRWTPVDEATLRAEYDEAEEIEVTRDTVRWPGGWFTWQTDRARSDLRVIRATKESTR